LDLEEYLDEEERKGYLLFIKGIRPLIQKLLNLQGCEYLLIQIPPNYSCKTHKSICHHRGPHLENIRGRVLNFPTIATMNEEIANVKPSNAEMMNYTLRLTTRVLNLEGRGGGKRNEPYL